MHRLREPTITSNLRGECHIYRKKRNIKKHNEAEDRFMHQEVVHLSAWKGWSCMVNFSCRAVPRKVRLYIFPEHYSGLEDGASNFKPLLWHRLILLRSVETE